MQKYFGIEIFAYDNTTDPYIPHYVDHILWCHRVFLRRKAGQATVLTRNKWATYWLSHEMWNAQYCSVWCVILSFLIVFIHEIYHTMCLSIFLMLGYMIT